MNECHQAQEQEQQKQPQQQKISSKQTTHYADTDRIFHFNMENIFEIIFTICWLLINSEQNGIPWKIQKQQPQRLERNEMKWNHVVLSRWCIHRIHPLFSTSVEWSVRLGSLVCRCSADMWRHTKTEPERNIWFGTANCSSDFINLICVWRVCVCVGHQQIECGKCYYCFIAL